MKLKKTLSIAMVMIMLAMFLPTTPVFAASALCGPLSGTINRDGYWWLNTNYKVNTTVEFTGTATYNRGLRNYASGSELDHTDGKLFTVKSGGTLIVSGSVVISGNYETADSPMIEVENGGKLILKDTATLTNGKMTRGDYTGGGAVLVRNGGTFEMQGGTISNCNATKGGAVYVESGGTFNMTGGTITGGDAGQMGGGGIYAASGSTCNISNATVKDCSDSGIITAGNFKMSGTTEIKNNSTSFFGGGISIIGGTAQVSSGVKIINNKGYYGAGLSISGGATATINGIVISSNQAMSTQCYGAGVFIGSSSVNIKNSTISANSATNGGGIYTEAGSLTLEDSEISGNTASGNGGGIFSIGGTYENKNTIIKTNSAANGGGVYIMNGNFTMTSGTITENSATTANSSGLSIGKPDPRDTKNAYFYLNGGSIAGNNDGDILIDINNMTNVILNENGSIDNNTISNVYLSNDYSVLRINSALSSNYKVHTKSSPTSGQVIPIAVANNGYTITASDLSKIMPQSNDQAIVLYDNKLGVMLTTNPSEPTITTNLPSTASGFLGEDFTLRVAAFGQQYSTLTYQWYKDNTLIEGATNSSYTIKSPTANDNASYYVTITCNIGNNKESLNSSACVVSFVQPVATVPYISSELEPSKLAYTNDTVTLTTTVDAPEKGTLSYQWYCDNIAISGATTNSYSISNAQKTDTAKYKVVVTNTYLGATSHASSECALTILDPVASMPVFTTNLKGNDTGFAESNFTFSVVATVSDEGTISYQWYKNDEIISGATNSSYTINSATTNDSGAYKVVATNTLRTSIKNNTSSICVLLIKELNAPVIIKNLDSNKSVAIGNDASLTIETAPVDTGVNVTYQWYKNDQPISNANEATYVINNATVDDKASYKVIVTNEANIIQKTTTSTECAVDIIDRPTWIDEGNYDISWYNENDTEYSISTAKQLAGVAKLANSYNVSFSGKTITLENDIDLTGTALNANGLDWVPIKPSESFCGVLDGNGYSIINLKIHDILKKYEHVGFIDRLKGTVKNLTLKEVDIERYAEHYNATGGISGCIDNNGMIDNCFVTGKVKVSASNQLYTQKFAGGICGYSLNDRAIIKNCGNYANVINDGNLRTIYTGGIVGMLSTGSVSNCFNNGTVSQGGIAGRVFSNIVNSCNGGSSAHGIFSELIIDNNTVSNSYFMKTDTINTNVNWTGFINASNTNKCGYYDETGTITLIDSNETYYGEKTNVEEALNAWVDDNNDGGYRTWAFTDDTKPAFGAYRKIDVTVGMSAPSQWLTTDSGKEVSVQALNSRNNAIPRSDYSVWYEGDNYTKSKSIPQAAGVYTATFEFKNSSSEKYQLASGSTTQIQFTIQKADNVLDVMCYNYTYGGTPQPYIKQNVSSGAVTYEYKPYEANDSQYSSTAPTNVGKYTLKATSAENDKYNSRSATVNFTIQGIDNDLDIIIANQLYGKPIVPEVLKNASGGAITYQYKKKTEGDSAYTAVAPQASGNYIAKVTSAQKGNYNETTVFAEFNIAKTESTLEISCNDVVYGDAINPVVITNTSGGNVSYEYKSISEPDSEYSTSYPENVGQYTIKATSEATDNYYIQTATTTVTLEKRSLSLTEVSAVNREYNGDTEITVNATLQNVLLNDNVSIDVLKATMADKNVGTNKAVTVTELSLKGDDAQNYEVQSPSNITVNISKKSINTDISAIDRAYNGTTFISYSGGLNEADIVARDDVRLNNDMTLSTEDANASDTAKNVTINATLTGDDAQNYNLIPQTNLSAVISKATHPAPVVTKTDVQAENGFGSILGVTTDMEYQVYGADTWQDCTSTSIENLEPVFYSVRYKGSSNYLVSDSTDVFILEYAAPASYNVSGYVIDENGEPIENVQICLMQGKTQIAPTRKPLYTNAFGMFSLTNAPSGIYNLVITKDGKSKMVICMVGDEDLDTGTITLYSANLNSKIEMQDDNGWYAVDGLNGLFDESDISNATGDGNAVELKFTAKTITDSEEKALLSIASWNMTDCYDLSIYKTVTRNSVLDTPQEITELSGLITIYMPLSESLKNKRDILAGRIHNGQIEQLTTTPNADGEYFEIIDDVAVIHTMKFSKYALYYKTSSSSGGGSYVSAPSANYASGEIAKNSLITLDSSMSGAKIYYTLDGSVPTIKSTFYTQPITAKNDMTIKYIATVNGRTSNVLTRQYKIRNLNAEIMTKANEARYIKGYEDSTFKPDNDISRYETIQSLSNIINFENASIANVFSDVSTEYEKDVNSFVSAGIIDGFEDGTFNGDQGLTRAEFVKIMSIILKLSVNNSTDKFTDTQGHWAQEYIAEFTKLGYLKGYEDGSFKPDQKMTRAEFVTIVNRIIQKDGVSVPPIFSDLSAGHWAYTDIMAAYIK